MNLTEYVYGLITEAALADDSDLALKIADFNGDIGAFSSQVGKTDYTLIHHLIARNLWRSALSLQAKVSINIIVDCYDPLSSKLYIPTFLKLMDSYGFLKPDTSVEILAHMVATKLANNTSSFSCDPDIASIRLKHLDDQDLLQPYSADMLATKLIKLYAKEENLTFRDPEESCRDIFMRINIVDIEGAIEKWPREKEFWEKALNAQPKITSSPKFNA
jgi:hypothetical protein